jgi:signal transduction histidine kinase/CheY-like chemotaxis protein
MTPIRAEAIRTLYAQIPNSAWSAIVVSVYMAGTAAPYTQWRIIAAWVCLQTVSQVARQALVFAWRRRQPADADLGRWATIYTLYMVVTGAIWGSTIYLFAHPDQPITVALTMCCLYAVAAGSTPANAYNPPGLVALVGLMFAPIVVRLLATGRLEYILLGVASGLYAVAMIGMCRVQAKTLDEGYRIRFENRALLEEMTLRRAEADHARHRAEIASLAKSQFLAAASHDLRQPLYALSLFSASLEALKLDSEGSRVVGQIQDSIGTMESLFDGLLDLSKLEAGIVVPCLAPVSVDAVFDRLSQYFHPIALARGLDLRFRSDNEWITSDAVLLEQVLGNLVSNALRHTRQGGVLVAARRRGGAVRLDVWDTGIGIAEQDLERIFEEFVQIGNAGRDGRHGLGLGLSIARRSGALIGGSIDVSSRLGRGTRFGLAQPACAPGVAPRDVASPRIAPVAAPLRDSPVLIVDDDATVRAALGNLLSRWGVRYETACDGEAALALVEGGARFGLVLADYRLGAGMDGLSTVAAILARQDGAPPEAALITADVDPALLAAADKMGMPVFQKPVRPAALRTLLEEKNGRQNGFPQGARLDEEVAGK